MNKLNQEYIKSILDYNSETGVFTWKKRNNPRILIGSIAGSMRSDGYIAIKINKKNYKAHRLVFLYLNGMLPDCEIDHINHDRSDNRLINLRIVDRKNNMKNKSNYKNNSSGVTGVYWCNTHKKWKAQIGVNGKYRSLGYFTNLNSAIFARKDAEKKLNFHYNHGN